MASTAPSTETPMVPPSDRKNVTDALAAPRSPQRDGVLHGQHQVLHRHADADADDGHGDADRATATSAWSIMPSPRKPSTSTIEPATMYGLILPVRLISRPETVEDTSTPAISGMVSRPASVGRVAAADLEVLAEEHRAAEHRHADREARDDRERGRALDDDVQRHDRLADPRLDQHGEREQHEPGPTMARGLPRDPVEGVADERDPDQQEADAGGDEAGARGSRPGRSRGGRFAASACAAARRTRAPRSARRRRSTSASPATARPRSGRRAAGRRPWRRP